MLRKRGLSVPALLSYGPEGNIGALMNASSVFEDFINTEIAACDVMQAHFRSPKKMMISFDEYGCNVSPQRPTTVGRFGAVDRSTYPEFFYPYQPPVPL